MKLIPFIAAVVFSLLGFGDARASCTTSFSQLQNLINQDIVSGVNGGIKASTVNSLMNVQNNCYVNVETVNTDAMTALGLEPNTNGGVATWPLGAASLAIGGPIAGSNAGYGLYVGTSGSANLLEQFMYGSNVFGALGNTLNGTNGLVGYSGQLGTPTQGVLTNATGLPISAGVSGLGTNVATALGVNVGSAGAVITNGGALGTPASGVLTHATGLPISTGLSGLGTGVATALGIAVNNASGFPLVNSTLPTVGHCLQWGSNGVTDAGGACTTGGGGGTVSSGNAGQLAYYGSTGTTVSGLTSGTSGQFLVVNGSAVPAFVTASGDCTLVASGALTCTKTNGTSFSALATTAPGTGVATALGVSVGSAGAFVVLGGALGTPSSGTLTNATGLPTSGIASGALPSGVTINNGNWSGTGLALGNLATQAANTILGNATASTAVPTALAMPSCSTAPSALQWTTSTGFACNTSITAAAVPATGITAGALGSSVTVNNANWSGTALAVSNGGTGQTSALVQYGVNYGASTTAEGHTAAGSTGQVIVATTGAAPAFGSVPINGSTLSTSSTGASLNLGSANTWTGTQTFSGTSSTFGSVLANAAEPTTIGAAISSPLAYYLNTQSVYFSTTAQTANWTVNFAFSSGTSLNSALSTGQTVTAVLCALQGATAYYNSAVQIDGVALTTGTNLFWQGGSAPSAGNASGYDCYSYTILKTGSAAYIVLGTQTQF